MGIAKKHLEVKRNRLWELPQKQRFCNANSRYVEAFPISLCYDYVPYTEFWTIFSIHIVLETSILFWNLSTRNYIFQDEFNSLYGCPILFIAISNNRTPRFWFLLRYLKNWGPKNPKILFVISNRIKLSESSAYGKWSTILDRWLKRSMIENQKGRGLINEKS